MNYIHKEGVIYMVINKRKKLIMNSTRKLLMALEFRMLSTFSTDRSTNADTNIWAYLYRNSFLQISWKNITWYFQPVSFIINLSWKSVAHNLHLSFHYNHFYSTKTKTNCIFWNTELENGPTKTTVKKSECQYFLNI